MRNSRCVSAFVALVLSASHFVCAEEQSNSSAADTEQLIAKLRSDEFDARKAAMEELAKRADKLWDRLKKLNESDADPDVRSNARVLMAAPAQNFFKAAVA